MRIGIVRFCKSLLLLSIRIMIQKYINKSDIIVMVRKKYSDKKEALNNDRWEWYDATS